jgi:hypothetical protein
MAKPQKKLKEREKEITPKESQMSILGRLEEPKFIFLFFLAVLILVLVLYKPIVFEGMEPGGGDSVSNIGIHKQLKTWEEKTGHFPLWNPYMFGGMPTYQLFGAKIWSVDTLIYSLDFLIDWRIWYFVVGALGIFLLVRFLGLPSFAAMISALAFILMPHFQALIIVGHFAKFRALIWMPYVLLTFLYLNKERSILSGLLFSLAFAIQFRTQHYQIIFYTLMMLLFMGIPPLYYLIKEKKWLEISKVFSYFILAVILSLLIAAQIFFSIKEYTPYSTRGGYAISIKETAQTEQDKKGVGFDYATTWSYSISEFWNLIVPKFHGGTSNEVYTGNAVPAFKNRELPAYWGTMPFTQSYEYMGILLIYLALIGMVFQWS